MLVALIILSVSINNCEMNSITSKDNKNFASKTIFVPKMDDRHKLLPSRKCDCYEAIEDMEIEVECRCFGKKMLHIPKNLNKTVNKLIITDADIKYIKRESLAVYRDTLKDVHLINLPHLAVIEEGTFAKMPYLRTLYISQVPQLKTIHGLLAGVTTNNFKTLRIIHTSIEEVPDLVHLPPENTMFLIDLDHNQIEKLQSNSIKANAHQVTLNFNQIQSIEDYAFNGSQISTLFIRGNPQLTNLSPMAFAGLKSLRELDLSQTSIENLPTIGLNEIESLRIENTPAMKTIPSIYDLSNLRVAKLTHPFHCCAFKYPEQHNPLKHAQYQEKYRKLCKEYKMDTGQNIIKIKREIRHDAHKLNLQENGFGYLNIPTENVLMSSVETYRYDSAIHGRIVVNHESGKRPEPHEDIGVFHSESIDIDINSSVNALCGTFAFRVPVVNCTPEPNALNPCEDIMGAMWLRVSVWFVVILAVVGNTAVIVVVLFSGGEITVARFLICNLAIADFCMGLYLLLIACMDLHTMGSYFNFAFNWQYGLGCQLAGFLTVFASHLSIFTLTIITIERWFAITYAIHLTRRIRIGVAAKIMVAGWLYSILIAMLPLFDISKYSSTSICLPMEVNTIVDKAYLYVMLLSNGVAFILIVFCYGQIYFSLNHETRNISSMGEMTIAKKMALLIFTDFATWAPIAFFGLTALAGYPLIGVTRSKILLVFFYPINACANPYLYAIMTDQYRRDFFILLSKCGLCKNKSRQYTISSTIPFNSNYNAKSVPLIAKVNGIQKNEKNTEDTYV